MKNQPDVLSIFDFDKTLIKKDSFRIFSLMASENARKTIIVSFLALCHKLRFISNSRYKECVLQTVWFSKKKGDKTNFLKNFFIVLKKNENKKVFDALKKNLAMGDKVVVISASPFFYLAPYFESVSDKIEVIGSKYRQIDGVTESYNLYGDQKVLCAKTIIQRTKATVIRVYTDHISDIPLVHLANKAILINPSSKFVKKVEQLNIEHEIYLT